jgi:Mn2+/Fe2+ NRAMP family transporter
MIIANDQEIMGQHVNGRATNILGWSTTVLMSAVAIAAIVM